MGMKAKALSVSELKRAALAGATVDYSNSMETVMAMAASHRHAGRRTRSTGKLQSSTRHGRGAACRPCSRDVTILRGRDNDATVT